MEPDESPHVMVKHDRANRQQRQYQPPHQRTRPQDLYEHPQRSHQRSVSVAGAGPPPSPGGPSNNSDSHRNNYNRGNGRYPSRKQEKDDEDEYLRRNQMADDGDEGGYRARALASHNSFDRTDEDVRKLNKSFESQYAKTKFKGDYNENWELFCDEFMEYCKRQRVTLSSERVELFPIIINGNAKQFFLQSVKKPSELKGKQLTWSDIHTTFANKYASDVKKERMSSKLQSLHIYHFEGDGSDASQALENLVFRIDKVAAMAINCDRTDEAKAVFLKSAVMATPWGVTAISSLKCKRYSYQDRIEALYSSIADEAVHAESISREEVSGTGQKNGGYRKTRWHSKRAPSEGLFTNQRRFGVDPTTIQRGNASTTASNTPSTIIRHSSPCFNCEKEGCMLGRCKEPKDWTRIKKKKRSFANRETGPSFRVRLTSSHTKLSKKTPASGLKRCLSPRSIVCHRQ